MSSTDSSVKPTVVFVPEAYHEPEHYSPIISSLKQHSYPCITVSSRSIGAETETTSLHEEIPAVREILVRLVEDEKKDVVLVTPSWDEVPKYQDIRGLEEETRATEGKEGGIFHCMSPAVLKVSKGKTPVGTLGGGTLPRSGLEVSFPLSQLYIFERVGSRCGYRDFPAPLVAMSQLWSDTQANCFHSSTQAPHFFALLTSFSIFTRAYASSAPVPDSAAVFNDLFSSQAECFTSLLKPQSV